MKTTFLEKITAETRAKVVVQKAAVNIGELRSGALETRANSVGGLFRTALARPNTVNIIAEIKRASPSKGVINDGIDVATLAAQYEDGGAAAISVLTEERYFGGSLDDLRTARSRVNIPLLRKDFIVDEYQILEAASSGANAVLLIVAALSPYELGLLLRITRDDLKMDALVEIHTSDELKIALDAGADIIGVNNRDLHSLEVSLNVSRRLAEAKPAGSLFVAESGLTTRDEMDELRELGFDAFLMGETLMRNSDPCAALRALTDVRS